MRRYSVVISILLLALSSSCALKPKKLETYSKDGIHFRYYSTWQITKDAPIADKPTIRSIQIQGPNNAIVMFICQPPSVNQTLKEFADTVAEKRVSAIKDKLKVGPINMAEVTKGTSSPTSRMIGGVKYDGIGQHFSVDVLGQQVPHDAEFYLLPLDRYHIFVMTQVGSGHRSATEEDWRAILESLQVEPLNSAAPPN